MNPPEEPSIIKPRMVLPIVVALAASAGLIWYVADQPVLALVFALALAVMGVIMAVLGRGRRVSEPPEPALPDWSVTLTAIEQAGQPVAICDRANRMVCANTAYHQAFSPTVAPARLPVADGLKELFARAALTAWRDGRFAGGSVEQGEQRFELAVERSGRADEFLIWRFIPQHREDRQAGIRDALQGGLGRILSSAGIEVALVDGAGTILAANPGLARRAVADESASLTGQDFVRLLRTDERDRIFFAREGRKGSPQTLVQVPLLDPEADTAAGQSRHDPATASLMLLIDSGVGIGGWSGDVKAGTPQLESLLGQLPLGLAMTDRDGHFLFANNAFLRAAGLEGRSLPPYPSDLVIAEDKTALSDAVRRYGKGPASSGDMAVRLRSSPDDPVSLGLAGVRGLGEPAVLLSLADTTEETRLKQQVAQATKMQAVGQLAGGVAHDFNNVLTAIIGYCDLMLLRHTPGDSDYDDIQQIKANSNRAASLTRQLLAFSCQQTLRPEVLQLPDIVSEVSQLLKRLLGAKITLQLRHDRELGPVRADPRQLEQVIVNLAVNARDAIQAQGGETTAGTLTLSTRRITPAEVRQLRRSEIIPAGDYTALIAEDTGGGIPQEILGKIFEPFFTTKEQGKGTGLGLSTVYGIVKQSGGFIFADNVLDEKGQPRGARFTIYLPVHQGEQAPAQRSAGQEQRSWSGGGRILLVEDEDMVRAVAERALARQGYEVVTASDGDEGLEQVKLGRKFDLVVSDVVMPSMDGPAMAREIRKLQPDLPILFMSGYAEEQLRKDIAIERMHFIAKPFSVQQIADKVAKVLGGG